MSNIPTVKRIRLKFPQKRRPRNTQAVREKGCKITIQLHSSTCCLLVCKEMMEVWRRKNFLEGHCLKTGGNMLQELGAGAPCVVSSHKACAISQFWSVHIPSYFPIKQGLCFHTADKETPRDTPQAGNISACRVTRWPEGLAKEWPSNILPKSTFNSCALWSKSF